MKGKVIVQAAGMAYPKTQAQIDADASARIAADTQAALKLESQLKTSPVSTRPGPNHTTIYQVKLGYGDGAMAWMRFDPAQLIIQAGDSVEWIQQDVEDPHTVTFTSGSPDPDIVVPEPQQSGPPKLVLNPQLFGPAGATTYTGKGYVNSGVLWGTKDPTPGPRTFLLTLDTPGTYNYVCGLHDDMGMVGQIKVLAKK